LLSWFVQKNNSPYLQIDDRISGFQVKLYNQHRGRGEEEQDCIVTIPNCVLYPEFSEHP